jgi:multidrug efflux pump subunit AcrB
MKDGKQYYVIAEAQKEKKNEPLDVKNISVKNEEGDWLPRFKMCHLNRSHCAIKTGVTVPLSPFQIVPVRVV